MALGEPRVEVQHLAQLEPLWGTLIGINAAAVVVSIGLSIKSRKSSGPPVP
jgi:hypothetical protein